MVSSGNYLDRGALSSSDDVDNDNDDNNYIFYLLGTTENSWTHLDS